MIEWVEEYAKQHGFLYCITTGSSNRRGANFFESIAKGRYPDPSEGFDTVPINISSTRRDATNDYDFSHSEKRELLFIPRTCLNTQATARTCRRDRFSIAANG